MTETNYTSLNIKLSLLMNIAELLYECPLKHSFIHSLDTQGLKGPSEQATHGAPTVPEAHNTEGKPTG